MWQLFGISEWLGGVIENSSDSRIEGNFLAGHIHTKRYSVVWVPLRVLRPPTFDHWWCSVLFCRRQQNRKQYSCREHTFQVFKRSKIGHTTTCASFSWRQENGFVLSASARISDWENICTVCNASLTYNQWAGMPLAPDGICARSTRPDPRWRDYRVSVWQ